MNWAMDWHWFEKDPRGNLLRPHPEILRIQGRHVRRQLVLDGQSLRRRHSPGLVATNGWASLAATDKDRAKKFAEALWKLNVPQASSSATTTACCT